MRKSAGLRASYRDFTINECAVPYRFFVGRAGYDIRAQPQVVESGRRIGSRDLRPAIGLTGRYD